MTAPEVVEPADLDLARYVRAGDMVAWGQACAEPVALTTRLLDQRGSIGPFRCFVGIGLADTVGPQHADLVSFLTYCGTGRNRALIEAGTLDVVPCHYSQLPRLLGTGPLRVDVLLLLVSPPDRTGRYSLGLADEYLSALIDRARLVIAQVDEHVPWTFDGRGLTDADLDVIVPTSRPPTTFAHREPRAVDRVIARRVAELVEDGSTIQLGVGSLSQAILGALGGHRDLGVHTGLMPDGVVDLVESGAVTGADKARDRGCVVTGMVMGGSRLFDFVDRNPSVRLRETAYTHDPAVLRSIERFVAINSALEVDLSGQVNAEVAGAAYVGAVGGAVDFLRGANESPGGLPIIALPSTAGDRSRIVAQLNGPVTTPRSDAGIVVTEHGVADLRGRSLARRRDLLLALCDPSHRDALEADGRGTAAVIDA